MFWRCFFCGLLLAAVFPVAAAAEGEDLPPAEDYAVRLEYRWWEPQLTGTLQKGFSSGEGTVIDAQADLGIERSAANELSGTLRLGGGFKFHGSWTPLDWAGDEVAQRTFTYGTTTVEVAQRVVTSIKGRYAAAEIEWDFLERRQGFVGVVLGAKYFDVDTVVVAVGASRVAETERFPVPVIGLAGRVYPNDYLSLEARVAGLPAGDHGHLWEVSAAARAHLGAHVAATAGWRKLSVEGHDGRDSLALGLERWTLGVELSL